MKHTVKMKIEKAPSLQTFNDVIDFKCKIWVTSSL